MNSTTTDDTRTDRPVEETSLHEAVCRSILEVAPDLDPEDLLASTDLRDDLGLDSIDLVNVAGAIAEHTGVEIPDAEFARLRRIGSLVDFVRGQSPDRD